MKFKIVESTSKYDFEYQLEWYVKEIEKSGCKIIDVKYGGVSLMSNDWGGSEYYSAMIMYKE